MARFLTNCVKYRNLTLISWCGNFVERHRFRRVSGKPTETNCAFPQNFHTRKSGEISV